MFLLKLALLRMSYCIVLNKKMWTELKYAPINMFYLLNYNAIYSSFSVCLFLPILIISVKLGLFHNE